MQAIRGKDTKPEIAVRRALHARGYRYRLNRRDLPGKPDILLPKYRAVIFVHGCFWHGHDCALFKWPATRKEFWRTKIEGNVERDQRNVEALTASGWRIAIVWECALKGHGRLGLSVVVDRVVAWLDTSDPKMEIHGIQ